MLYWQAFMSLSRDRVPGFGGDSDIPTSSIDRYVDRHGFDGMTREALFHHLTEMDRLYLTHRRTQVKQAMASGPPPGGGNPNPPRSRGRKKHQRR